MLAELQLFLKNPVLHLFLNYPSQDILHLCWKLLSEDLRDCWFGPEGEFSSFQLAVVIKTLCNLNVNE